MASFVLFRSIAFAVIQCGLDFSRPLCFEKLNGETEEGVGAENLVELCRFFLKAREFGLLHSREGIAYAQAAESLIVSIAKVGVAAIIDEATGFQHDRDRDALQKLLDRYLRKEYAAWAKRFPGEFMYRCSDSRNGHGKVWLSIDQAVWVRTHATLCAHAWPQASFRSWRN
jgi:hypothetical protein